MKHVILLISLMLSICANAQIDTLSYAAGHQFIRGMLAGNFPFIETQEDIMELYRGIEDNIQRQRAITDSVAIANYSLGSMQAVFFSNSWEHASEENYPPVSCIISGLRKVADDKLSLPQDSIEAKAFMASIPDSINPVLLPQDERCRYFTAYGILKGIPHGLTELGEGYGIKNFKADYRYYAQGFADMLEATQSPKNAYEYGRMIGHGFVFASRDESQSEYPIDTLSADFLAGIRAGLQLEPVKLSENDIQAVFERYASSFEPAEAETQSLEENFRDTEDVPLAIRFDEPYEVEWTFEAFAPALYEDCSPEIMDTMVSVANNLQTFGIKAVPYDLKQVIFTIENDNQASYYITEQVIFKAANEWYSEKADYYKFFCGKDGEGKTIFGVTDSPDVFLSKIFSATLYPNRMIQFHFGNDSSLKSEADRWAEFTKRNINKLVVCEVNDEILMCPKVQSEITSGGCAIQASHLSNRYINNMFAKPLDPDAIEIIEIQ